MEAKKRANDALMLDKNCVNGLLNMGIISQALGDSVTAKKCFDKVTDLDHENAKAWLNLGNILAEQEEFELAAFKYLQALMYDPDDDKALTNLAICLSNTAYAQFADIAFDEAL